MDNTKNYMLLLSLLACSFVYVKCDGEIHIIHQMDDMKFYDDRPLYSSELKWVLGTCMGYLAATSKEWQDLHIGVPFDYNRLVMVVGEVPKAANINVTGDIRIPLMEDEPLEETLKELNPETSTIFDQFTNKPFFKHLNTAEMKFPKENILPNPLLQHAQILFDSVSEVLETEVKKKEINGPKLFWGTFPDYNEPDKNYSPEGLYLTTRTMKQFGDWEGYGFKVMVIMVSHDGKISLTRRKRQVSEPEASTTPAPIDIKSLNLADDYDENFPVIFNIMLWFSLALLFSLIAISMVIANMDPGRDSIIYRMTSTRMKKDN